ncbi:MAG: phosphate ABC transporter permease subunit PstC [Acidilobaceae archaeon]|nr:phosphate ABC transporter permease subunit PstC [Acidilobaceae archaeon]
MSYARVSFHDKIVFYSLVPPTLFVVLILMTLFLTQLYHSIPIFDVQGLLNTYTVNRWYPTQSPPELWKEPHYGLLPTIWGTIYVSGIAVLLALPLSISLAVFIEELLPRRFRGYMSSLVDLMAGTPTILFGLWGLSFLGPLLKEFFMEPAHEGLGFLPIFSCTPLSGTSILTAGVMLAVMIIPFMVAVIQESYKAIPVTYKEAAWSLGLTRFEYVRLNLSMIVPAIVSAVLLGLGRASSETAAVALVVGNIYALSFCMFSPTHTLTSIIAANFGEVEMYPYMRNALFAGGLFLLTFGMIINAMGIVLLRRIRF